LSGRWDFSSGADAGDWALLGGFEPDQGPGLFLVPRADYQVIDDSWYVSGLKGTGSKDIVIDSPVFVPTYRFLGSGSLAAAQTPGRASHQRATYQLSGWPTLSYTLVAPVIGMAQGAVEAFEALIKNRFSATRQPLSAL